MEDSHRDIFPALRQCESVASFEEAAGRVPGAVPISDARKYAANLCNGYSADLAGASVCESIRQETVGSAAESSLTASGETAILGIRLPAGASLRESGRNGPDSWQSYSIDATEAEIEGFFARTLTSDGWSEDPILPNGWARGNLLVMFSFSDGEFRVTGS